MLRRSAAIVVAAAAAISILSFIYFFARGMTNNYGDGVAHVNIARKVVDSPDDSLWQRYVQIGSPWLPLQTTLMLPLVISDPLWRTGAAGSIISMLAFVCAAIGLFLLARDCYGCQPGLHPLALPGLCAAILVFNPSVIYLQSTPMTELLFMATLVVAVLMLQRWVEVQTLARLLACAVVMALASLSRYEAWPVLPLASLIVALRSSGDIQRRLCNTILFFGISTIGVIYWLWHNWAIYGNAFEFLTGPNSARGLYLQNRSNLGWSQVFVGNALLDTGLMLTAVAVCVGPALLIMAAAGTLSCLYRLRRVVQRTAPALLLGVPFVFHVLSLYRGEIQVFPLSAFGLLNVRYGLLHLLLVALLVPAATLLFRLSWRRYALIAVCAIVAAQYWILISDGPEQLAVYQEGYRNGVNSRTSLELAAVSEFLRSNPQYGTILMHTGALGPLVPRGGLRFSQIVHEGTARWHRLDQGIPEDVSTVIVQSGDPLDRLLTENAHLTNELNNSFMQLYSKGGIRVLVRRDKRSG